MLLQAGQWLGRGSLLVEGASLGEPLECDLTIEQDSSGLTLTGTLAFQRTPSNPLSIRVAPDEVGTYVIDARIGGVRLDGVAKLESAPNLGLLWHADGALHATFALFEVARGYGFRGFLRERDRTLTWEVAFALKQDAIKASNVVTLRRRR
ncbi:MAG: hypothetical protein F4149_16320 [Gammaproteobacteria bacterium]|nr:hypothetical protein [Gammaproteobacteria bacterium]MYK84362.1 hypothetical protein [Gammaproteobacteria bacterium]